MPGSNPELMIFIGENKYRGQRLGYDATKTLINFCFGWLNLHRIYLFVTENNEMAIRMYEKVGFQKEGIARDDVYVDNKYINTIRMSIINEIQKA